VRDGITLHHISLSLREYLKTQDPNVLLSFELGQVAHSPPGFRHILHTPVATPGYAEELPLLLLGTWGGFSPTSSTVEKVIMHDGGRPSEMKVKQSSQGNTSWTLQIRVPEIISHPPPSRSLRPVIFRGRVHILIKFDRLYGMYGIGEE